MYKDPQIRSHSQVLGIRISTYVGRDIIQPTADTIPYVIQGGESTGESGQEGKSQEKAKKKERGGEEQEECGKIFP